MDHDAVRHPARLEVLPILTLVLARHVGGEGWVLGQEVPVSVARACDCDEFEIRRHDERKHVVGNLAEAIVESVAGDQGGRADGGGSQNGERQESAGTHSEE